MDHVSYHDIRKHVLQSPKYPVSKLEQRSCLMNKGFPGTFHLSFGEEYLLNEFGRYTDFDHDYSCSSVQSVIRVNDIIDSIAVGKDHWKYLGVFELADVAGMICLKEQTPYQTMQEFQIKSLLRLLTSLGLKRDRIYPSYCIGGDLKTVSQGKYDFDFTVPEDFISRDLFMKHGIPKRNLIPDQTRNTFLCLHLHRTTPWGYRNEIHYDVGNGDTPFLLDIGTIENFLWLPVHATNKPSSGDISGVVPFPSTLSLGGVGVERLTMAVNQYQTIREVDYLKPFYQLFTQSFPMVHPENSFAAGESLRALHRICSDCGAYNVKLSKRQVKYKNELISIIDEKIGMRDFAKLSELLITHSATQPWHPELKAGIQTTIEVIKKRSTTSPG